MEEAKFSFNTKFRLQGIECQFTIRDDEGTAGEIFLKGESLVKTLIAHGAEPTNGRNGKRAEKPIVSEKDACPNCGVVGELELIKWTGKDGTPRAEWKCQACKKWLPSEK